MAELASSIARLSSYLEYLGKGIELKNFDTERQRTLTRTPAIQLSTVNPDTPQGLIRRVTSISHRAEIRSH